MLRYPTRLFTTARALNAIPKKNKLPPRPKWLIKEEEINKTNSKVQLTHKPTGIVVTCQATRSQEQNRKKAREILALKLDDLYNPKTSRNAVLTERAQKVKQSKTKKSNRKYRTLDEAKEDEKAMRLQQEQTLIEELSIIDEDEEFDQFVKTAKVDLNGLKE